MFDPVVWFFVLGFVAGLARADLRLPTAVYELVSMVLLLAIGLKGGVELARQPVAGLLPEIVLVIAIGVVLPLIVFPIARLVGRLAREDAAALAAHYGSVSVGTFAVVVAYLATREIEYERQAPLWVVLLEVPAIIVGILLAQRRGAGTRWGPLLRELLLGRSIVLLVGGLAIGWLSGAGGLGGIDKLFFDLFKGVLALFLLEMGLIAAAEVGGLRRHGPFLIGFGVAMPCVAATLGAAVAWLLGLSPGGTIVLATLAASASYIAAPAAFRTAVPRANPALSLAASLAVTFPFNILVGIPLYERVIRSFLGP
ncbi:MAG TPA: sodium-dependent bicarbonate transport family permease [Steroidobacteraceae bacterium]|nr:sodium-dependent bicarbonate transport family permease [Steroidobacteraceae bacterium]